MFSALNIDRGNLSNALSDNLLDDIKLTQADYVSGAAWGDLMHFRISETPWPRLDF